MGIEIDLSNLNISGNAEIMNDVKIRNGNDVHISLKHAEINEQTKVLNNLEVDSVLNELRQQAQSMDKNSAEYLKIKKIIDVKQWNKDDFAGCVIKHIGEFSQGVLASIVANFITK